MGFLGHVIDFLVREAKANKFPTENGVRVTWDGEFYFHAWWEGEWFRYGTSERAMSRVEDLGSSDVNIVANWFIYQVMNTVRYSRSMPVIFICSTISDIRPGWSVEEMEYPLARLVRPDGEPLEMAMYSVAPTHPRLLTLSWIVDAEPRELFDSFLDPDGRPLLSRFVERT